MKINPSAGSGRSRQAKKTPCKQCEYYFGKNSIHCALYPYGKQTDYCNDWQKVTIMQRIVDMIQSQLKNFSYAKAIAITGVIVCPIFLGYELYQAVPAYMDASRSYEQYTQGGEIFLERAGSSGTTGIAQGELNKAVSWLESSNSNQSFEFENLQANLNYLKKQPDDSLVPVVIKESINESAFVIKQKFIEQRNAKLFDLCSVVIAITIVLIFGSRLIIVFHINYEEH